ncbi:hypothetical protein AU894_28650, partial [Salmonella enterica subsp. enterica]|nr:hypothetical protein [Salmonella enterica subsp. enterica serovar Java]
ISPVTRHHIYTVCAGVYFSVFSTGISVAGYIVFTQINRQIFAFKSCSGRINAAVCFCRICVKNRYSTLRLTLNDQCK